MLRHLQGHRTKNIDVVAPKVEIGLASRLSVVRIAVGRRTMKRRFPTRSLREGRHTTTLSCARVGCSKVYTRMKRQALEKRLRECGWSFLRHGRRHDIWTKGRFVEAVPRHVEINDRLARAILRRAEEAAT